MAAQEEQFTDWVRDALVHLHDNAHLERQPLAEALAVSTEGQSQAEALRRRLLEAVEALRPASDLPPHAPEWRPYRVLQGCYVEGLAMGELGEELALSARQLRREKKKALQAVASFLMRRMREVSMPDRPALSARPEAVDTTDLLQGIAVTLRSLIEERDVRFEIVSSAAPACLTKDRVAARLALLTLLRQAVIRARAVVVKIKSSPNWVELHLEAEGRAGDDVWPMGGRSDGLTMAERSLQTAGGRLQKLPAAGEVERLLVQLPAAVRPIVLVIDDEPRAVRMYRRYLSQQDCEVQGMTEPQEALRLAAEIHPRAIVLDVMMPQVDGWELLQRLKAQPETAHIPVLVCSVWNEPDLALSLGASGFLRKPVTQQQFLSVLGRLLPSPEAVAADPPGSPAGSESVPTGRMASLG